MPSQREEAAAKGAMGDGEAGEAVHPEAVPVELPVGLAVEGSGGGGVGQVEGGGPGGELATVEGVVDTLTGEWFDNPRCVAGNRPSARRCRKSRCQRNTTRNWCPS